MLSCAAGRLQIWLHYLAALLSAVWSCLAWGSHITADKGWMTTSWLTVRSFAKKAQKACLLLGLSSFTSTQHFLQQLFGWEDQCPICLPSFPEVSLGRPVTHRCFIGALVAWVRGLSRLWTDLSALNDGLDLCCDLETCTLMVLEDWHRVNIDFMLVTEQEQERTVWAHAHWSSKRSRSS